MTRSLSNQFSSTWSVQVKLQDYKKVFRSPEQKRRSLTNKDRFQVCKGSVSIKALTSPCRNSLIVLNIDKPQMVTVEK
jgi:hypothetical protein